MIIDGHWKDMFKDEVDSSKLGDTTRKSFNFHYSQFTQDYIEEKIQEDRFFALAVF